MSSSSSNSGLSSGPPSPIMAPLMAPLQATISPFVPTPLKKAFVKQVYNQILAVYDREFRLNWRENMLGETDVVGSAVQHIEETMSGATVQESTVRSIYQRQRPKRNMVPLPEVRRAISKQLYDFIVERFDHYQAQQAAVVRGLAGTIPAIFSEIRATKDAHILHVEISVVMTRENRIQGHLHLSELGLNVPVSFGIALHDALIHRAMECTPTTPLLFDEMSDDHKDVLGELMRRFGEMRNNDWWANKIFVEVGELLGFDMSEYPEHVLINQDKYMKIRTSTVY